MTFCRAPGVFPSVIAIQRGGWGDSTNADARDALSHLGVRCTEYRVAPTGAIGRRQGAARLRWDGAVARFLARERHRPYWRWTTIEGPGLGHTDTPMATIPPGIRFIHDKSVWEMSPELGDSIAFGRIAESERAIDAFYSALSARVALPTTPSLKWMLASARVLIRRNDTAAAERSIRRVLDAYPGISKRTEWRQTLSRCSGPIPRQRDGR